MMRSKQSGRERKRKGLLPKDDERQKGNTKGKVSRKGKIR